MLTAAELARRLRQQAELGAGALFLEHLSRAEALGLARKFAARAAASAATVREPASPTGEPGLPELGRRRARGAGRSAARVESGTRAPAQPAERGATFDERELTGWDHADAYREVRDTAFGCVRCRLHEGRSHVVFSDGNPQARVMVVGEAPGAEEDRKGLPFVGPAGQLLDLLLATVALSRDSVYICNVVKCRPPGNRNPLPDEIETCLPYLRRQIELVAPEAILALGAIAVHTLLGRQDAIKRLRGVVHRYEGIPVVVTYHPAALLRNPRWTPGAWEDLQLLRRTLEGERGTSLL
ncbi:MAG: uracil-DNA glycosylase [Gemmatimonadetes bacterium]|nr:uracil-DNA glycosylase [Gemmatimonadota bacterium]